MRARVLAHCARVFPPGGRVLDLGCGPGLDASVLVELGYRVVATDASAGMVEQARRRGVDARQIAAEEVDRVDGEFDGVLSDFGALNCVDLPRTGRALAAITRPGTVGVFVVMGPSCPAETVALLLRGRGPRRGRPTVPLEGGEVAVRWLRPRDLGAELGWKVRHVEALGALVPPPDLGGRPGLLSRWDMRLGPLLRRGGDHTLVGMER